MPNVLGPITNWELEISGFEGLGGANFSGDDPTNLKGQSGSLSVPDRAWATEDSTAGGIAPDRAYVGIEPMECTFNSESYAVDAGGATLPMLWGLPFTLTSYQHIRDDAHGLPRGQGQRVLTIRGTCRSITESEQTQRSISRLSVLMDVFHFRSVIKSGSPQFGASLDPDVGTQAVNRTTADIIEQDIDTRLDSAGGNGVDLLEAMAAALGYAA